MAEKTSKHYYTIGESFTLSSISSDLHWSEDPLVSNYGFTHWTTTEEDKEPFYFDKSSIVINENTADLYAQWEQIEKLTLFKTQTSGDVYFSTSEIGNEVRPQTSTYSGIVSPYKEKIGYIDNILEVDCDTSIDRIGHYGFSHCSNLSSVDCPNVTWIGVGAFENCLNLSSINCPNLAVVDWYAFLGCQKLNTINCSEVSDIARYGFFGCSNLSSIDCSKVMYIGISAFQPCPKLSVINLSSVSYVPMIQSNTFDTSQRLTAIVPSVQVDNFRSATNWSTYYNTGNLILNLPHPTTGGYWQGTCTDGGYDCQFLNSTYNSGQSWTLEYASDIASTQVSLEFVNGTWHVTDYYLFDFYYDGTGSEINLPEMYNQYFGNMTFTWTPNNPY